MSLSHQEKKQTEVIEISLEEDLRDLVVYNDDFNTFEHVANCLMKYIPHMTEELAWELTNQVHYQGLAIVWVGPMEQAELYHAQLKQAGLTMAPLEPE